MAHELRSEEKAGRALRLLQAAILALTGWWAFAPALMGWWIWDDLRYLPNNVLLHDPARLWKTWFAPGIFNEYYPLTATVQFIQWSLWGSETPYYHATNMALHIVNAFLVWKLFEKLGLRLAWLGGMIFAVHPLTVESVAWIVELKNTLSLAPFLLAMIFYLDYEEQGRERDYWLALGLFLTAMLAKVTMAPFPAVILLYAWWKRGRIRWNDLRAAMPFLVIAAVLSGLTTISGIENQKIHPEADQEPPEGGWEAGPASAGLAIFFFIAKFFWPTGLMLIYPRWLEAGVSPYDFLPWIALTAIVGWLWWKRKEGWSRNALLGLGFFLIMLTPALSMFLVKDARMVRSLDHLAYIPMIGLTGLTVAVLGAISARLSPRLRCAGMGVLAVALAVLAWGSHTYAALFQDEETLWKYTLERNPHSSLAHETLGNVLQEHGRNSEAMEQYRLALRYSPINSGPHVNMALFLFQSGRTPEAMAEYAKALEINPKEAMIHYDLGNALTQLGREAQAIVQYQTAIKLDPDGPEAHYNLGNAFIQTGHVPEAVQEYEAELRLNPDHGNAHANLGNALLQLGRVEEALREYVEALRINPNDADVHTNMGVALMQLGRLPEARTQFEAALLLDPHNATAQTGLSRIDAAGGPADGSKVSP
ncbi:MAG: tetratricopeptide repeat protein [Methylacidiphilales bacterium]|nr:tetratricopeptide repeat protein [Candidatus Methylacidiphilales bacterium]